MDGLECIIVLFYIHDQNYFVDEMGQPVYNLFDYITPGELQVFKSEWEDMFILRADKSYVEIIAPDYLEY